MPRVPKTERSVESRIRVPDVSVVGGGAPEDFGALEARAIQKIGGDIAQVGSAGLKYVTIKQEERERLQEDLDIADAQKAFIEFNDGAIGIENISRSKKGRDAVGETENYLKRLDALSEDIRKNLKTENAKEKYTGLYDARRLVKHNSMNNYEFAQYSAYTNSMNLASAENEIKTAAGAAASDDTKEGKALKIADARVNLDIALNGITQGMPNAQKKTVRGKYLTNFHIGIINALKTKNAQDAQEYYDKHVNEIDGTQRAAIQEGLKVDTTLQEAHASADLIINITDDPAEQMKLSKKLKGEVRKQAETIIRADQADKKRFKEREGKTTQDLYTTAIMQSVNSRAAKGIAGTAIGDDRLNAEQKTQLSNLADSFFRDEVEFAKSMKDKEKIAVAMKKKFDALELVDQTAVSREQLIVGLFKDLEKSDLEEVLEYQRTGGIVKGLTESRLRQIYQDKTVSTIETEDDVNRYMAVRDYVVSYVKAVGRVDDDTIVDAISRAVIKTPKTGIFGFRKPGKMLGEHIKEGTLDQFIAEIEIPEDETTRIINRLNTENARRERAGERLLRIDNQAIKSYYLKNVVGLTPVTRPVTGTPVTQPQPGATPTPTGEIAQPTAPKAEEIKPLFGSEEPLISEEIKARVKERSGLEISDIHALELEASQYPNPEDYLRRRTVTGMDILKESGAEAVESIKEGRAQVKEKRKKEKEERGVEETPLEKLRIGEGE
jgi:hypothetical protein